TQILVGVSQSGKAWKDGSSKYIEVWVHLDEKRMCQLEQDLDIKTYAFLVE
nr:pelargonidin 3-O-(6-caffeoylglucoside) 5-O-(6-O-malonylglucoside) 4'''-malonyltransferase-like [Tanacetum cinerariifolium]